ncbi:hypothetical protein M0805_000269 [Coniferiporia weirii]|nr:hypothetical protein M0805_000269 [Coniferiporia weirii]
MEDTLSWEVHSEYNFHGLLVFFETAWPYIIPPLLVISIEAPLSLRTWLAVQDTPLPSLTGWAQNEVGNAPRYRVVLRAFRRYALTHIVPAYLITVAMLGTYLQCAVGVPANKMTLFDTLTLAPLFVYATWRFFNLCFGVYTLGVQRSREGDPYVISKRRPHARLLLTCLSAVIALFVSYRAIMRNDTQCTAIVHAALLRMLVSSDVASPKSFRSMVLYSVTNVATILALLILLFMPSSSAYFPVTLLTQLAQPGGYNYGGSYRDFGDITARDAVADTAANRWPFFALAVLWNIFPAELIVLCYRLDFSLAQRCAPLSLSAPLFSMLYGYLEDKNADGGKTVGPVFLDGDEDLPLPELLVHTPTFSSSEKVAEKVAAARTATATAVATSLPARHPPFSAKPFFRCALFAHTLSSLLLLALASAASPAHALPYAGPLLPLATMPLAVLAVLAFGAARGREDWGALWCYEETWGADGCGLGGAEVDDLEEGKEGRAGF